MPFGIQGITAEATSEGTSLGSMESPMPFGIQGITAISQAEIALSAKAVSNAFRHSGHHCQDWTITI